MEKTLFNDLLQSLIEAKAIASGRVSPSRYFKYAAVCPDI